MILYILIYFYISVKGENIMIRYVFSKILYGIMEEYWSETL